MLSPLRMFSVSRRLVPGVRWFSNEVVREQGEVKWFNPKRGYGFILCESGKNIFVHQSQVVSNGFRALLAGEKVQFEITQDDKSRQSATKVTGPNGVPFKSTRLPRDPKRTTNNISINVDKKDDSRVINISITLPESFRGNSVRVRRVHHDTPDGAKAGGEKENAQRAPST